MLVGPLGGTSARATTAVPSPGPCAGLGRAIRGRVAPQRLCRPSVLLFGHICPPHLQGKVPSAVQRCALERCTCSALGGNGLWLVCLPTAHVWTVQPCPKQAAAMCRSAWSRGAFASGLVAAPPDTTQCGRATACVQTGSRRWSGRRRCYGEKETCEGGGAYARRRGRWNWQAASGEVAIWPPDNSGLRGAVRSQRCHPIPPLDPRRCTHTGLFSSLRTLCPHTTRSFALQARQEALLSRPRVAMPVSRRSSQLHTVHSSRPDSG